MGGFLLALGTALLPVVAVIAVGGLILATWNELAHRRGPAQVLAGATLGSGLAFLWMATTTIQSCSQTSDFCGNANVVPLVGLAVVALGTGLVGSIATQGSRGR